MTAPNAAHLDLLKRCLTRNSDDYARPACHKAVDDFRATHGITETIDWTGAFWRKNPEGAA